ncbi:hypothetical protein AKJ09_00315 [Labilithrix luteola]|uniref:DUF5050 domain-containing protein n=1 Tax=Labilithrix luteola TaxID=1391654 RepID=A0A0K1PJQ9_9BACT|nr:hypothetical protein AKJ09_00315 [Labilithrix luteola]
MSDDPSSGEDGTDGTDSGDEAIVEPQPVACTVDTCPLETVLDHLYGPVTIASSGHHLYFVEVGDGIPQAGTFGWFSRVPTDKSCTQRSCFDVIDPYVASGQLQGQYIYDTHLALGPNNVCFTQSFNASPAHKIRCYDLVGFDRTTLDESAGQVVDLWVGSSTARWALVNPGGTVQGAPLSGTGAAPVASGRTGLTSVTSDGTTTYFTEKGAGANAGVVGAVLTDGGVRPLATGRDTPAASTLYGGYVYWAEVPARKILRAKVDGTGAVEQIANTDETPFELAVDATGVYWASVGPGASGLKGSVSHAGLAPNGPVDLMMKDLPLVYDVAVDSTHVYAATVGASIQDGKIVRIPKTL